jgi:hypothetical protein
MVLPDGVRRRLLLLLNRADRQLINLVPHPLGRPPPKHLLRQHNKRKPEDSPDATKEPAAEPIQRKTVVDMTRAQVPDEARNFKNSQEREAGSQTHDDPGAGQRHQGGAEHGQLHLLVPHDTLRSPQLVQTDVELGIRPGGRGRQRGVGVGVAHDKNKEDLKRSIKKNK